MIKDQPSPVPNNNPSVHDLVCQEKELSDELCKDLQSRKEIGLARYGTSLQVGNGRNSLIDAYQEILDSIVYLRKEIGERSVRNRQLESCYGLAIRLAEDLRYLVGQQDQGV